MDAKHEVRSSLETKSIENNFIQNFLHGRKEAMSMRVSILGFINTTSQAARANRETRVFPKSQMPRCALSQSRLPKATFDFICVDPQVTRQYNPLPLLTEPTDGHSTYDHITFRHWYVGIGVSITQYNTKRTKP